MKRLQLRKQFNWRALLMRIVINALLLALIALILPNINFVQLTVWNILFLAIALGVLNAFVKPIIQFLTLSFIFTTYGLIIVLINAVLLWLLAVLFPDRFAVNSILAALLGGVLIGILGSFLESLLGLSPPIIPEIGDESSRLRVNHTPVVTKIILGEDEEEEPSLADSSAPLPLNNVESVAGASQSALNRAQEHEVDAGKLVMQEETMPVAEDLENADTLTEAAAQVVDNNGDDSTMTAGQPKESGPWQ